MSRRKRAPFAFISFVPQNLVASMQTPQPIMIYLMLQIGKTKCCLFQNFYKLILLDCFTYECDFTHYSNNLLKTINYWDILQFYWHVITLHFILSTKQMLCFLLHVIKLMHSYVCKWVSEVLHDIMSLLSWDADGFHALE